MKFHIVHNLITGETRTEEVPDDADVASLIADCPECRASGQQPQILQGAELEAALQAALAGAGIPWRRRSRGRR